MMRLNRHIARAMQRFSADRKGVSAVEFAMIAPVFLIIIAGIVDVGGVLYTKYRLNAAISAGSNYALVNGQDIGEDNGSTLALNIAKLLAGQESNTGSGAEATVAVNNGTQIVMSGGTATSSTMPGNATSCYCPQISNNAVTWGTAKTCGSACSGGGIAGKFVTIKISRPFAPMFGSYGVIDEGQISISAVVQGQ
jgi:Flp pilus assembly protein TadG